jgi:hypothetical protein
LGDMHLTHRCCLTSLLLQVVTASSSCFVALLYIIILTLAKLST